ncbi:hypothetical protein HK102_010362, partial [Quaeritorhiza haematococci]
MILANTILRPVVSKTTRHPIETIAICLLIASACYFSLIHLFKQDPTARVSSHLAPPKSQLVAILDGQVFYLGSPDQQQQPQHNTRHRGRHQTHRSRLHSSFPSPVGTRFSPASGSSFLPTHINPNKTLLLRQIVIDLPKHSVLIPPQGVLTKSVLRSVLDLQDAVTHISVTDVAGRTFSLGDLCFRKGKAGARGSEGDETIDDCSVWTPLTLWKNDRDALHRDHDVLKTITKHLQSSPDTKDANIFSHLYFRNLTTADADGTAAKVTGASSLVLSYLLDVTTPSQAHMVSLWEDQVLHTKTDNLYPQFRRGVDGESASQHRDQHSSPFTVWEDLSWKVTEFLETSSNSDIIVLFVSFLLMHATFVTLFMNMRSVGSRFSLGFAVLINGTFALLVSL